MITKAHHVAMIVSSEHSLNFYKLLGFSEILRETREYDTVVLMDGYDFRLEIFIDPRHPMHISGEGEPRGLRHFALKVDGKLEDEIERLKRESSEMLNVGPISKDWTGVRFCYIKDYDGVQVEIRE